MCKIRGLYPNEYPGALGEVKLLDHGFERSVDPGPPEVTNTQRLQRPHFPLA